MSALTKTYSHRPNDDGTYDSICHMCARTVARGVSEAELAEAETLHNCPGRSSRLAFRIDREL
jgi:hypothetical protein